MNNVILKCEKVVKKYDDGALSVQVLNGLDLEVSQASVSSVRPAAANRRCCISSADWIGRLKGALF